MLHDRDEAHGVGGQLRRPHKRDLRAPLARGLRDLFVFGRDDDTVEALRFTRRPDGPGDQRTSGDVDEVLARDRLRSAPGRNDSEYLHGSSLITTRTKASVRYRVRATGCGRDLFNRARSK